MSISVSSSCTMSLGVEPHKEDAPLGESRLKRAGRRGSQARGFGIAVIATPQTSGLGKRRVSSVSSGYTGTDGDTTLDNNDTSMSSEYTLTSIVSEEVVNHENNDNDNQEDNDGPLEVDVSFSTSTLRRASFNKHATKNDNVKSTPNGNNNSNNNSNTSGVLSQRFRSTPNVNNIRSPTSPQIPFPKSNTSSPSLPRYGSFQNSQSYIPSKLSRRRSTQHLTKKQRDKLYDESNNDDTFDDDGSDLFMYNVPIASTSSLRMFQNGNATESRDALRKAWNESESNLIIPPSPLPGSNFTLPDKTQPAPNFQSPSLQKNPSFIALSPAAQQLSTFYEYSSHTQATDELEKRKKQANPQTVNPEAISALDDLSLASAEKLSKLTVTRPSWIPPKNKAELEKHEREFKKLIDQTSKKALKTSKHKVKLEHNRVISDSRLNYLSKKETLTSTNCNEIRKYILVTDIDNSTKFLLFRKMIVHKLGSNALLSPPFKRSDSKSSDEKTVNVSDAVPLDIKSLFPSHVELSDSELVSLETILQPIARPVPCLDFDINKLPKIPALPIQTVLSELARIAYALLKLEYSTPQVRDIVYWLHVHVFTVKFKEGFAKSLLKPSVIKLFKDFKDDYSILSIPTSLDLLLDLSNEVIAKCIELLIVFWGLGNGRGVKMFVAIISCIIRDYHFGWNNLQVIFHAKAHVYIGEGEDTIEKFFSHVLHLYGLI